MLYSLCTSTLAVLYNIQRESTQMKEEKFRNHEQISKAKHSSEEKDTIEVPIQRHFYENIQKIEVVKENHIEIETLVESENVIESEIFV